MYRKFTKFIRDNVDEISWRWCDIVYDYFPHLSREEVFRKVRATHLLFARSIREKDFDYLLKPMRDEFREWILLKHRFQDLVNLESVYILMLREYIESHDDLPSSDKEGFLHIIRVLRDSDIVDDFYNAYVGEQEKLFRRQIDELNVLNEIAKKTDFHFDDDPNSSGKGITPQKVLKEALNSAMAVLGATDGVIAFTTEDDEWVEVSFLEAPTKGMSRKVIDEIKAKSPKEFDPRILTAFSHVVDKAVLQNYWNPENVGELMREVCPACQFRGALEARAKGVIDCPILSTLKVSTFLCHHFSDNKGNSGFFLVSRSIPPPLTQEDMKFIATLSGSVLTIIDNILLYKKLSQLAITDGMTGLYNHRHFQELLKNELARSKRYGYPVGLLMIDIDHFKKFNDTYGHQVGDEVLKAVARTLRRQVRTTDAVSRYGGEEITVILPHTGLDDAGLVGEKVRQAVEVLDLPVEGKTVKITISVGVAGFPDCATEQSDLILEADNAMYRAKENGRNQVQMASPQATQVAPK
jgi:diguanylate cyclase (GGDEF)-like protein